MTGSMVNKKTRHVILGGVTLCFAAFGLSGCVTTSGSDPDDALRMYDPFESTNRAIFAFNDVMDDAFIHPIALGYRQAVPEPARNGLRNFLRNLKSPVRFLNQLLQGDLDGAGDEFVRTAINTTVGVGGLFDVAGYEGLKYEEEDFGQTLAVWGVGHGPYLVLPLLGPSSLRDYSGYIVDAYADPLRWYAHNVDEEEWYYARLGAGYLDLRESLLDVLMDLESSSIDYYAAVRSTYLQRRNALVNDEIRSAAGMPDIPDFDD